MCHTHHPRPYRQDELDAVRDDTDLRAELCRGGRVYRVLVNRRTRVATALDREQMIAVAAIRRGTPGREAPAVLAELRDRSFFTDPHARRSGRLVQARTALATLDVRFAHGQRLVALLHRLGARHLFHPVALVAQAVLALAGLAAVVHTFRTAPLHLRLAPSQVPLAIAVGLLAIAVHEAAHALVVVHHGRRIDAIGLRLHLGVPAFYVESVDALLLGRRQRLAQAFAGSWAEWQVTSLVALWVTIDPTPVAAAVLLRFVLLNTFTIASNLMPFTGLDGQLILADLLGEPDLGPASRGAVGTTVLAVLRGERVTRRMRWLTAYAVANGIVACGLLLTAVVFWYSMFGGVIAELGHAGPIGWAVLVIVLAVVLRPAAASARARTAETTRTAHELLSRVRFRAERWWRIAATEAFAAVVPALRDADERTLSVVAGQLTRAGRQAQADVDHCHVRRGGVDRSSVHAAGDRCRQRGGIVVALPAV